MNQSQKIQEFNTSEITNEVTHVIRKGLNDILKNYIQRHQMLEDSCEQIMKLPIVIMELNKTNTNTVSTATNTDSKECEKSNKCFTIEAEYNYNSKIEAVENGVNQKIASLENIILNLGNHICKLEQTIQLMNENLILKLNKPQNKNIVENKNITELTHLINKSYENDVAYGANENKCDENIKLIIAEEEPVVNEEVIEEDVVEEEEQEEEKQEEEDQVEEEEEEDQVEADEEDQEEVVEEDQVEADEEDQVEEEQEETEIDDNVEEEVDETDDESIETTQNNYTKEEEDEDDDVFEIDIDDTTYCTNNEISGFIWELTEDGEQGNKVGYFKESDPIFYADQN